MNNRNDSSQLVEKGLPCTSSDCSSSDAMSAYDDGHTYCFSCETYTPPPRNDGTSFDEADLEAAFGTAPVSSKGLTLSSSNEGPLPLIGPGTVQALQARSITKETCQFYGYTCGKYQGETVHIANYQKAGEIVGQKIRTRDKGFKILGQLHGLFGEHLYKAGGKRLALTEGEIDALSVHQALKQTGKSGWPAVSIPNGAPSAVKAIEKSYDFVSSFDEIILMFDMDEQGQRAARAVANILPPGKAFIANMPLKDPNEMLMKDRVDELRNAFWNAKEYRPDGIVAASSLWDSIVAEQSQESVDYPWPDLNTYTRGLRKKELVTIVAGTGIGKSTFVREVAYDLITKGHTLGMIMLEENNPDTMLHLMGIELEKQIRIERDAASLEEMKEAFNKLSENLSLYDHFGSLGADNLINRIRYLAKGMKCDFIILDHISIAISAIGEGNERRSIDQLVTNLRQIVEETNVGLIMVSHLSRTDKTPHEEGGQVSLSNIRGSHGIAHISDIVIALERNQQDPVNSTRVGLRVLKNRFSGETGLAANLRYEKQINRLIQIDEEDANTESAENSTYTSDDFTVGTKAEADGY